MKHYTNTNNPVDFPGSDHHSGDGGYSLGSQKKYTEFVKVRNYNIGKARIRQLIVQAGGIGHDDDGDELTPALVGKSLEKFAELIVRECMEQVWYSREDGINGNVSQVIKDRIKEHFGVEE